MFFFFFIHPVCQFSPNLELLRTTKKRGTKIKAYIKNFAALVALRDSISCLIGQNDVNQNHEPADFDVLIS